ncbi:MAG: M48 family metallopeptidase [Panacagrimonas sp.]
MRTALIGFVLITLVACATSPLGRKQLVLVSDAEVSKAGVSQYKQMQQKLPLSTNATVNNYVRCISTAITREVPRLKAKGKLRVPSSWEMTVFASKDANAFAMPGGKMGVFTGLLKVAKTQDQLAAVVGHEISHVLAGHSAERYSSQVAGGVGSAVVQAVTGIDGQLVGAAANAFLLLPYSRAHETEADLLGLDLMAMAGFDPRQAIQLWKNMAKASGGKKPPEMMSTHPSDATRISNLNARLKVAMPLYDSARAAGKRPACGR